MLCSVGLVLLVTGCTKGKTVDERMTLWRNDKIPYGTWYAYNQLGQLFPQASISTNRHTTDPAETTEKERLFSPYDSEHLNAAFITVAFSFRPDQKEMEGLMGFVGRGGHVFISAAQVAQRFLDTLQLQSSQSNYFLFDHDTLRVKVYDPVSWEEKTYTYPGKAFDNYFTHVDSAITTVLGKNANGKANFVKIAYESGGAIYLHLAPLAFTNFFLLHKDNKTYYDKVLSWLPKKIDDVRWDDYFRNSQDGEGKGQEGGKGASEALTWMRKQPAFAAALGLMLLLLLFIYVFESKRKQRVIPAIAPLRNTSLDFVKTIGRMYFQRKDNKDLVHKMIVHFMSHVRSRYQIRATTLDDDFVQRLAFKSGYDPQAVQTLVYALRYAQDSPQVTDDNLLELNHKLETFYKKA
ncbi:DUF4350 domain-containing protein [Paraflavitalea pollutisoli]|uniref:DUF4350 domain-containing protein n=1 Tax=Paraflavitalea pollutisoli TaxID=3034143 RepID=UPI0023EE05A7|nr:DUF4350 domain-containing protein [Paraflavitalea sp. H1-2-19X]